MKHKQVFGIVISWALIGMMIAFYDHLAYYSVMSNGVSIEYSIYKSLFINISVGIVAGIIGGVLLVYYINERYRHLPYYQSFLLIILTYFIASSAVIVLVSLALAALSPQSWAWSVIASFLFDPGHLKNGMVWLAVLLLTQIALQVKDKFGSQVLIDLIAGKYHRPKEETRIFMFVDLISSTTIAERLSNEKYHLLLRDFYADITNAIIDNSGEIYQYVGDEVVISWKFRDDHNDNCLRCFFEMTQLIIDRSEKYISRYGVVPEFKAGVHYGKVIAGEIGILKRDITFSGDVLNTTSRIQGKCNEYKVKILASDEFISILPLSNHFRPVSLGNVELRGKGKQLGISTVQVLPAVLN